MIRHARATLASSLALTLALVACGDVDRSAPPSEGPGAAAPSAPSGMADSPSTPPPTNYAARGHAPGWSLELDGEAIAWRPLGGPEAVYSHADRRGTAEAFDVDATLDGRTLSLRVERRTCHDPMGGMPSPDTVVVVVDDRTYRGCGGVPATDGATTD